MMSLCEAEGTRLPPVNAEVSTAGSAPTASGLVGKRVLQVMQDAGGSIATPSISQKMPVQAYTLRMVSMAVCFRAAVRTRRPAVARTFTRCTLIFSRSSGLRLNSGTFTVTVPPPSTEVDFATTLASSRCDIIYRHSADAMVGLAPGARPGLGVGGGEAAIGGLRLVDGIGHQENGARGEDLGLLVGSRLIIWEAGASSFPPAPNSAATPPHFRLSCCVGIGNPEMKRRVCLPSESRPMKFCASALLFKRLAVAGSKAWSQSPMRTKLATGSAASTAKLLSLSRMMSSVAGVRGRPFAG